MNLSYNDVVPTLSNAPQFNGNMLAITWNNGTGQGEAKQNGYRYSCDPMNRITDADYRQKKSDWGQHTHLDDDTRIREWRGIHKIETFETRSRSSETTVMHYKKRKDGTYIL
jgi:hypothetical protein